MSTLELQKMIYAFNKYHIDSGNFSIKHNKDAVAVEPRVFDLIVYLIENKSQVVSREELFERVWNTHNVSDATLSNHIKIARTVLGDDAKTQHVIKTIHGRGYQFVANLDNPDESASPKSNKWRIPYLVLIVMLMFSIAALIYLKSINHDDASSGLEKSIAVLAFLDMSPEQNQEYFSDGISEEILNKLVKIPELRVISQTSSFFYKGKDSTAKEIGDQLHVSHILEGSVRKYQDKVRITVQLIDSKTSSYLWSETYDKAMDDILKVQYDIAQAVSKRLKISVLPKSELTQVNPEAYTLYLQAKYLTQSGRVEDLVKSELDIKKSIELDPNYAPSWHLLGFILFRATHNYGLKPIADGDKESNLAINKAIKLDPDYALSYATLARIENHQRNFSASEKSIQKALNLNRNNTYILTVAAHIITYSGKLSQALEIYQQIKTIDPKYFANLLGIGFTHYILNNYELAYSAYQDFDRHYPNTEIQQYNLCIVSLAMGNNQQALEHAKKEKNSFWNLYAMNLALFAVGEKQQADNLFKEFIDKGGDTELGHIARIYAFRGDINKSFESLSKAIDLNDASLIEILNFPDFKKMHHDPRWGKIIKRMNFPESHWLVKKLP